LIAVVSGLLGLMPAVAIAGEFDRIEGDTLETLSRSDSATRLDKITARGIESLPQVLKDDRSAFLIVKTDRGNFARLLISVAMRKSPTGMGAPAPVLVLERIDTFEPGKSSARIATGKGILLFDGFLFDLDAGYVVPENQGGDLAYSVKQEGGPTLRTLGGASLFTLSRPVPEQRNPAGPSPGKAVLPGDFAGRFQLQADGRWSGLLELEVPEGRRLTGRFRSESNGSSYKLNGEVSLETPHKAIFTIAFPRSEQVYEAFLWTEGKNAISGSFTMQGRTYGFVATRESADTKGKSGPSRTGDSR
jgi:hypothetical protein